MDIVIGWLTLGMIGCMLMYWFLDVVEKHNLEDWPKHSPSPNEFKIALYGNAVGLVMMVGLGGLSFILGVLVMLAYGIGRLTTRR